MDPQKNSLPNVSGGRKSPESRSTQGSGSLPNVSGGRKLPESRSTQGSGSLPNVSGGRKHPESRSTQGSGSLPNVSGGRKSPESRSTQGSGSLPNVSGGTRRPESKAPETQWHQPGGGNSDWHWETPKRPQTPPPQAPETQWHQPGGGNSDWHWEAPKRPQTPPPQAPETQWHQPGGGNSDWHWEAPKRPQTPPPQAPETQWHQPGGGNADWHWEAPKRPQTPPPVSPQSPPPVPPQTPPPRTPESGQASGSADSGKSPMRKLMIAAVAALVIFLGFRMFGDREAEPPQAQIPTEWVPLFTESEQIPTEPEKIPTEHVPLFTEPQPEPTESSGWLAPGDPGPIYKDPVWNGKIPRKRMKWILQQCGEIPPELENFESRFYYQQLDDYQKQIYEILLHAAYNHLGKTPEFNGPGGEYSQRIFDVMSAVWYDYSELYWFRGAGTLFRNSQNDRYWGYVEMQYVYEKSERPHMDQVIYGVTAPVIAELSGKSDYEKVKGVHDFAVQYLDYDMDYHGATLYEVLNSGGAVCEGYARLCQYMLEKLGVPCIYALGPADTPEGGRGPHAWNIVKVDGDWYQMDATWDDEVDAQGNKWIGYVYFLVTDQEMSQSRTQDEENYPHCYATRLNYHRMEGTYVEFFDPDQIIREIQDGSRQGNQVEFKLKDMEVYREFKTRLVDNREIFTYFQQAIGYSGRYYYWYHDNGPSIRFTWGY